MSTYNTQYVTDQGLAIPSVQDLLTAIANDQRAAQPTLNTAPDSPIGQMNGVLATHLRAAYEVAQIAFNAQDPNQAEGAALDYLASLTGTSRAPATYSSFQGTRALTATFSAPCIVPAGTAFSSQDGSATFLSTATVTSLAPGTGSISAVCTVAGPVYCNARQCTVFAPVSGLASVVNLQDAYVGSPADNDSALVLRRLNELARIGLGTVDALKSSLYAIQLADGTKPILNVVILENTTDYYDARGNPPHSLECVVNDGILPACPNNTIAQIIWNVAPGGINIVGATAGTATDFSGNSQSVYFTRPFQTTVYFLVTLWLTDPNQTTSQYSAPVIAAIQSVAANYLQAANAGITVYPRRYESAILQIPGVTNCAVQLSTDGVSWLAVDANLTLPARNIGYTESTFISLQAGT